MFNRLRLFGEDDGGDDDAGSGEDAAGRLVREMNEALGKPIRLILVYPGGTKISICNPIDDDGD